MTLVELLQQVGLSKYEAEAYYTLLTHGSLTGYEVGKHSHVPLSRSYEILERLTQKGLALLQPGDPPHYSAQEPQQFLGEMRSTMEATLNQLAAELSELQRTDVSDEFWVIRGRQHIFARARSMISAAQQTLDMYIPHDHEAATADALFQAQERGCRIFRVANDPQNTPGSELLLILVDQHEALIGTVAPSDACQAIVSTNEALLVALRGYFTHQQLSWMSIPPVLAHVPQAETANWLDWENSKQRRLWSQSTGNRVA
ncbi:MAG TPA: helix-turn-helix domain-containing protein [Ktedonobacteraceae bacterium]|nr:helix-turn-helix domain-containing protein [Ktedonobacteraceae bacterium]